MNLNQNALRILNRIYFSESWARFALNLSKIRLESCTGLAQYPEQKFFLDAEYHSL